VPHEILGVMPPSFAFPTPGTRFWKTSDLTAGQLLDRDDQFVNSLGRLAPGRTLEQARDELVRIHDELRRTHPEQLANSTPELVPLADVVRRQAGSLWLTLMGAVGLVLLIACLNLANLLLSRAAAREGELAVRRALGAGRGRLTRLVAAETLALSLLGGLAGLGVGWLLLRGILAWMPGGVPRAEVVGMDGRVLAFAVLVTGAAGLLFGLAPALRLAEGSLGARMRRGRGGTHLVRHGLVAAEIALAVVLVTGAGLTIRGYGVVGAVDPGFVAVDRAVFPVELQGEVSDGERSLFYRGLEGEVRRLPGVASAGVTSVYPMAGFTPGSWVGRPGGAPAAEGSPTVRYVGVSPAFREAAGIPLRRGRDLGDGDGRAGAPALLLSESAAALLFPGEDALGQQVYLGPEGVVAPVSTVVGVVGDVRQRGMAADPPPMAYVPRDNLDFWRGFHLVVESDLPADALAGEVRRIAAGLGSSALVLRPTRADGFVAGAMRSQRDVMLLFGLLAGVALVLAMVGVFGVVSYLVSRRRREIGVRMAVGAGRAEVQALVLAQSLVPAGLGAALGVLGAAWLSRFMEALVAGVEPTDALTFVTVPVALVAVTALASWLPARRAAALDPVRVLSAE
jgi:predicted permease